MSTRPVVAAARGVVRRYGEVTAVDGVDRSWLPGEVLGVVGRSGSGMSTLARLPAGREAPDAGTVALAGLPASARRRPGFVMPVFQDLVASVDRWWPLWRTLTEPVRARGERHPRGRSRELAAAALADVGLGDLDVDRLPGAVSTGQAQRVGVARALPARPALLVATSRLPASTSPPRPRSAPCCGAPPTRAPRARRQPRRGTTAQQRRPGDHHDGGTAAAHCRPPLMR